MIRRVRFLEAFKLFWKNYANFKGRSTRAEYWFVALWMLILYAPLTFVMILGTIFLVGGAAVDSGELAFMGLILFFICMLVYLLFAIATFIPAWAIMIRRFHDTGRTMVIPIVMFVLSIVMNVLNFVINSDASTQLTFVGIMYLIFSLVYLGLWIYVIVVLCLPSQDKDNKYGRIPYVHHINRSDSHTSHAQSTKGNMINHDSGSEV
ncbi:DUF805 domain-containing protein [Staphylococcus simulans]|uniref:DUF805 domain-containing protein n=1 Tax=Staphylococcus simulans TaxID=1286 RepID=UPI00399B95A0